MELLLMLCLLTLWTDCASTQEMKCDRGVVCVPEGDDVLLPCVHSSGQRVDGFDWRKNNGDNNNKITVYEYSGISGGPGSDFAKRVEFDPKKLSSGDASIILKNTDLKDNGTYICGLGLDWKKRQEFQITLNVGAARKPDIEDVKPIDDSATKLLNCTAHGVPEPYLEWLNSAGEVLLKSVQQRQSGRSTVQLQLKVTKSDTYVCVATQKEICHRVNNTRIVTIPENVSGTVVMAAAIPTAVLLLVLIAIAVVLHKCNLVPKTQDPTRTVAHEQGHLNSPLNFT